MIKFATDTSGATNIIKGNSSYTLNSMGPLSLWQCFIDSGMYVPTWEWWGDDYVKAKQEFLTYLQGRGKAKLLPHLGQLLPTEQ